MTTIYAITNRITGRTYIGRTSQKLPSARVAKHFEALRSNRHKVEQFQDDFNRFGEESFEVKYLDSFGDMEGARMEVFMMKVLRSQDRQFGYNYKDPIGTSHFAIADRWRTKPRYWAPMFRHLAKKELLMED